MASLEFHDDRLFSSDPTQRTIARDLYSSIKDVPIISPHGHTDPAWFANNELFPNPAELLIKPDHYIFRMLYSQGIALEDLGLQPLSGKSLRPVEQDPRKIWRLFAQNYHLFLGTPSRLWHDWVYKFVFGCDEVLSGDTADAYYDRIDETLKEDQFRPRELFTRYGIEVIATTEDPLSPLTHHQKLKAQGWGNKVITAFRPDNVIDPDFDGFSSNLDELGSLTGYNTATYKGYLDALMARRDYFKSCGATSTDHGHPSALTADLSFQEGKALFEKIRSGDASPQDAEKFRAHMLVEMARMSLEDGLVMQIHPGSFRNHNQRVFSSFGRDKGADIPTRTDYVNALRPLLNRYGNEPDLTVILFTLDETAYSRELAPLAGHYPILKLGPAWWFHDSPEGMLRFREMTTETAGFYNTVGFNDDTRAFLSIPARHDMARRIDCTYLAKLVAEHRLSKPDAFQLAKDLSYTLAKSAYRL